MKKFLKKKKLFSWLKSSKISEVCKNFCEGLLQHEQLKNCVRLPNGVIVTTKTNVKKDVEIEFRSYFAGNCNSMQFFKKCIYKKSIIHSSDYTRATKTDDTYLLSIANEITHVHHFVVINETCYIYGCSVSTEPYSVGQVQMDHIYCVVNKCGDAIVITNIENFKEKLMHIQIDMKRSICFFPYIVNLN